MKLKAISDDNRKISIDMGIVNAHTARWKPGTWFDITITRRKKLGPTDPQRGYYYAAVLPALLRGCGYDPDEALAVHRQLKIIFFHVMPDKRGIYRDKDIPSVFSKKSDIGQEKRQAFIDWVLRKAAEYGEQVE
jgi:hypothetical protein